MLAELGAQSRWFKGPAFLHCLPEQWPETPLATHLDSEELKKVTLFSLTTVNPGCRAPDANSFTSPLHGAAVSVPSASDYREGENHLLQQAQQDCVISDLAHLRSDKPLLKSRRLLTAPELDPATQLICVGGPLCRSTQLENEMIHPIVLDT